MFGEVKSILWFIVRPPVSISLLRVTLYVPSFIAPLCWRITDDTMVPEGILVPETVSFIFTTEPVVDVRYSSLWFASAATATTVEYTILDSLEIEADICPSVNLYSVEVVVSLILLPIFNGYDIIA